MDDMALTALRQSIDKWERNAVAEHHRDVRMEPQDCPLCDVFQDNRCLGCPVMDATGRFGCWESPYEQADDAHEEWQGDPLDNRLRATFHAAARAEAEFLRSLLPEGEATQ